MDKKSGFMSTPHVAGIAALVWAKEPGLSNQEVRNRIEQTADAVVGTGEPSPTPTPTLEPNICSVCFKGVCDGKCNPAKEGPSCGDCQ